MKNTLRNVILYKYHIVWSQEKCLLKQNMINF